MYVCICNAVTDTRIRDAAKSGVVTLWGLQKELGVSSNCGKCRSAAMQILRDEISLADESAEPGSRASSV